MTCSTETDALGMLGADLAQRGVFVELAVSVASALMQQFACRRSTEDVDAVVRKGDDERALVPSVACVAERMGL